VTRIIFCHNAVPPHLQLYQHHDPILSAFCMNYFLTKQLLKIILENAGVKKIRFHDLRHTYASLLLAKDVNIKYIQRQMGHSSFEITMNTYAHLMPEVYEKSKLLINELI
ncbi:MAG: site-specific integrase, partial [Candidatus Gastranaerophilales bacterium]|nr:site-specific integrase [Candidatus Gastranaerophilales bacterium]